MPKYKLTPCIPDMLNFTKEALSAVPDFTIEHEEFGMVIWDEPIDVRSLNIDKIVSFAHLNITVYLNNAEKPEFGCQLNKPATITFYNCWPKKQTERHIQKLFAKVKMSVEAMRTCLILYDHQHGKVTYNVDHFSNSKSSETDKHSSDSDNEDKNKNVTSKVDQGSMANGDDKTNKVFQANPDGQYNLSHLGDSSDSSDSNNE